MTAAGVGSPAQVLANQIKSLSQSETNLLQRFRGFAPIARLFSFRTVAFIPVPTPRKPLLRLPSQFQTHADLMQVVPLESWGWTTCIKSSLITPIHPHRDTPSSRPRQQATRTLRALATWPGPLSVRPPGS